MTKLSGGHLSKHLRVALVAATALVGLPATSSAAGERVVLGEVTARAAARAGRVFRRVVAEELRALDLGAREDDQYVLSASLVKLDATEQEGAAVVSCVVSATLRAETGGALVAILQGSARASDEPVELETVKLDAMRAAVRSAMRRLPEAIARAPE